jgi:hypothetical protein
MKPALLFLCLCALASGQPLPDQSPAWKSILARIGTNRPPATNYWVDTPFPTLPNIIGVKQGTNWITKPWDMLRSTNGGITWEVVNTNLFDCPPEFRADWVVTNRGFGIFKLVPSRFTPRRFVDDVPVPILLKTNLTLEVNGARVVK